MSESMARRLCLTGDQIGAEEALAAGYVAAIFDDVEALHSAALDWAGRISVAAASGAMKRQFVSEQPEIFAPDPD
jgi:enoyl-CoA hydratase/carnithine racemase